MQVRTAVLVGVSVIAVVIILAVAFGGRAAREQPDEPEPGAPPASPQTGSRALPEVQTAMARRGAVTAGLELRSGTVAARDTIDLAAQASGSVDAVLAREGDAVRKGQLLVQVESEALQAQVEQARAGISVAQARLAQAKLATSLQTAESDTGIEKARAQLASARAGLAQARAATDLQSEATDVQIEQARAALTQAEANLKEVQRGARDQERKRARLLIDQAKAVYDQFARGLPRRQRLFEQGAISGDEFGAYLAEYEVRKAQYESAKEAYDLIEEGATPEQVTLAQMQVVQAQEALTLALANRTQVAIRERDIEQAEAAAKAAEESLRLALAGREQVDVRKEDIRAAEAGVKQSRATLVLALDALDKTRIRSPLDGVVSLRLVDPGETVGPGIPVMRLLDLAEVDVTGTVLETDVPKVRIGMPAEVRVDALGDKAWQGKVTELNPAAIPNQRFFQVKIRVPNPSRELRPGMFARVNLVMETRRDCVLVPWDAVFQRDSRDHVYVIDDGTVRLREVEVGLRQDDQVQICAGVGDGDEVVVAGQEELHDGASVRTVPAKEYD